MQAGSWLMSTCYQPMQRANDVMMGRIRGYVYFDLSLRKELYQKLPANEPQNQEIYFVQNCAYTHLREVAPNTSALPALPGPGNQAAGMVYRLSCIRTDLDSFSDVEAFTLMYHAYALATNKLAGFSFGNQVQVQQKQPWRFLEVAGMVEDSRDIVRLARHLQAGSQQFLKTHCLDPIRSWLWTVFLFSPVLAGAGYWLYNNWEGLSLKGREQDRSDRIARSNFS